MTASPWERMARARLYLVASRDFVRLGPPPPDFWRSLSAAAEGGVDVVQLRFKGAETVAVRTALLRAREALPDHVLLMVNDDMSAVHDPKGRPLADGVHLGRSDAESVAGSAPAGGDRVADGLLRARVWLGTELLLGTSTRSADEIDRAVTAGADHVGFGAMAMSTSKSDTTPASLDELTHCLEQHPDLPIFPIGGMAPDTLPFVLETGVRRAAVGAAILEADDPCAAAAACRALLNAD
jgi:thiamine-phosphate pyrophosphorylase